MLSLVIVYVGLGALAPLLALAQRLRPSAQGVPPVFAASRRIDWLYWLVTPLGAGLLSRAILVALGAGVALLFGAQVGHADDVFAFFAERSLLRAIPAWAQLVVCLSLVDLLSYFSHRLRHSALFFPIHAVHHSSTELDWLAAARMHPLDEMLDNVAVSLPVLLLGPDPWVFLSLGPITLLYTLVSHAAVDLPLGPLHHVLVTPAFHRHHHRDDVPPANYAGMFSIWDRLFGTWAQPDVSPTARFGLGAEALAPTLREHLIEPVLRVLRGPSR